VTFPAGRVPGHPAVTAAGLCSGCRPVPGRVMPRLGVIMAAGRQARMLASVADRDRAVRILQASFVEGRLGMDEFEQRVGLAIVSRDFGELLALTADLPAGPFGRLPAHRVTPRQSAGRRHP
jgi:DUF1707 SHOCT-like domain